MQYWSNTTTNTTKCLVGWIKHPWHKCWVFGSSFDQKFLYFPKYPDYHSNFHLSKTKLTFGGIYYLKIPFQILNNVLDIKFSEYQVIKKVWDKQRGLIKILELEKKKKRTKRKEFLWKHSTQTPTEGEAGSLFSTPKAEDSDWVTVNIVWIIYERGWVFVSNCHDIYTHGRQKSAVFWNLF